QLAEMGKFNEELVRDGMMLAGEGLQASSKGARMRFDGEGVTVTDGPFPNANDLVAGFWIVRGDSKDEIVERFRAVPFREGEEIEIRQLFESDDFGENLTPELRAQEERLRAQSSASA